MRNALLLLTIIPASCTTADAVAPIAVAEPDAGWRSVATDNDRDRLRNWRSTFEDARKSAIRAGYGETLAAEGALLMPDSAIGGDPIPNGDYSCRVIKIGAKSEGLLDYVDYPRFRCRISGSGRHQAFAKLTGSQRQVGIIYPADAMRQVFLGTLVLGTETEAMRYGQDETRNVAGYIERIGPNRWRLIMPKPHFESQLDVLELVPVGE